MTVEEARDVLSRLHGARPRGAGRVLLETNGKVAHVRVDHPGARSAMTVGMMVDLADAVVALQRWDGVLVVLSSTDPQAFCSGGHLGDVTRSIDRPESAEQMSLAMSAVLDGLLDLDAISVSALDGPAVGGGAELCCATDFRVASPEASIHFVQAKLGITPGWGGAGRLVRLVGRRTALRLLTACRPLFPGEAFDLGLVDHRSDDGSVAAALAWLEDVCALPAESVRAVKRQVVRAGDPAAEAAAFSALWGGPAHRVALERLERHRR